MANILVVDMSYTATGWVVAEVGAGLPERIIAQGLVRTAPVKGAASKLASDIERCRVLLADLGEVVGRYLPQVLVVEQPCGREGYHAGKTVGVCAAVVAALRLHHSLPWLPVTAYQGKEAATGRKGASKEAVQEAVTEIWPEAATWEGYEHTCDALAALIAARNSDLYVMASKSA